MTIHLQKELDTLKKMLLGLSAVVEESVHQAVESLEKCDVALAEKVIAGDTQIDNLEVEIEEECLKALALYQPVAVDLRFIVAVLKINNDLERIGDLATNIAERTVALASICRLEPPFDYLSMAAKTQRMLKMSLDSLVGLDVALAKEVQSLDDEVDQMHADNFTFIKAEMRRDPDSIDHITQYLTVSRHLERIADLATNIAEEVYYLIEGEIVRHTSDWGPKS